MAVKTAHGVKVAMGTEQSITFVVFREFIQKVFFRLNFEDGFVGG
jgi:hypothetical protein